jgi:integrase
MPCHGAGRRDALMIFLAYRHGMRAAEEVDLRCEQFDLGTATLHVEGQEGHRPAGKCPRYISSDSCHL